MSEVICDEDEQYTPFVNDISSVNTVLGTITIQNIWERLEGRSDWCRKNFLYKATIIANGEMVYNGHIIPEVIPTVIIQGQQSSSEGYDTIKTLFPEKFVDHICPEFAKLMNGGTRNKQVCQKCFDMPFEKKIKARAFCNWTDVEDDACQAIQQVNDWYLNYFFPKYHIDPVEFEAWVPRCEDCTKENCSHRDIALPVDDARNCSDTFTPREDRGVWVAEDESGGILYFKAVRGVVYACREDSENPILSFRLFRTDSPSTKRDIQRLGLSEVKVNELVANINIYNQRIQMPQTEGEERVEVPIKLDNDIDLVWITGKLSETIPLLMSEDVDKKLNEHARRHIVCDQITASHILYHFTSVGAPQIRKFAEDMPDSIPLRGQEQLVLRKLVAGGGGMVFRYYQKVGVRLFPISRATRAALERLAKVLNYADIFVSEISTIYPMTFKGEREQDSDVANYFRMAIEDNRVDLTITEKDEETGKHIPTLIRETVYPASTIISAEDIKDPMMLSRYNLGWLPQKVDEFIGIGLMLGKNIGISEEEHERRLASIPADALTDEKVKAVYHTIYALTRGLLAGNSEAESAIEIGGVNRDCLLPVLDVDLSEFMFDLTKEWVKRVIERYVTRNFKIVRQFPREDSIRELNVTQETLLRELERARTFEGIERVKEFIEESGFNMRDEGIVRLFLDAVRRVRNSAILRQLQREFIIKDGHRILKADDEDLDKGLMLLNQQMLVKSDLAKKAYTSTIIISILKKYPNGKTLEELGEEYNNITGRKGSPEGIRPSLNHLAKIGCVERIGEGRRGSPYVYKYVKDIIEEEESTTAG